MKPNSICSLFGEEYHLCGVRESKDDFQYGRDIVELNCIDAPEHAFIGWMNIYNKHGSMNIIDYYNGEDKKIRFDGIYHGITKDYRIYDAWPLGDKVSVFPAATRKYNLFKWTMCNDENYENMFSPKRGGGIDVAIDSHEISVHGRARLNYCGEYTRIYTRYNRFIYVTDRSYNGISETYDYYDYGIEIKRHKCKNRGGTMNYDGTSRLYDGKKYVTRKS